MKPVAIFRHFSTEGPGYFATFLDKRHIPWQLIRIDAGDALPASAEQFSGLVFMGGPMSVNDDLPWIAPVLVLIRQAVADGIPVLGHCLGGQLMSKALGGVVSRSPVKEIGWSKVSVADNSVAHDWLSGKPGLSEFNAFHWHGETFSIPAGATRLFASRHCENQAFALGKHLALQCHVEMTEGMVKSWGETGAGEIAASVGPAVQSAEAMQQDLAGRVSTLNQVAERLYTKWVAGLVQ